MNKALAIIFVFFLFWSVPAFAAPLSFTVNMSEAVNVTGTPRISVNVGGVTRYADYASGTGTSALTFTYTPQAGDVDLDGVAVSSPVDLNGGTITDLNGNAISNLTFTPPNTANVKVDYPSLSMDFTGSDYILSGTHYGTLSSFLTAASGSFTRGSVGTYFDSTGTLQTAGNNVARFDHDPTTHVAKGFLMEESRTNYIRNSMMQGAGAGVPPTNWNFCYTGGSGATCTATVIGTGTLNGFTYVEVRFQGTMPATGAWANFVNYFDTTGPTITNTDYVSGQVWLSLVSGTIPVSVSFLVSESNGAVYLANRNLFSIAQGSVTGVLKKFSGAAGPVNASVNKVSYSRMLISSNGTLYNFDFTLRIAAPQVEVGRFPTSYIPTTTATVARSEDVLTIPVGAWYNSSAGSFYNDISWASSSGTAYPMFFRVDDGTSANRWNLFYAQGSNVIGSDSWSGGVYQGGFSSPSSTSGSIRAAGAQSLNNANVAYDGVLKTLDTFWNPPTSVTQLRLYGSGAMKWHKKLKYYPARVADTQLQLLTQ